MENREELCSHTKMSTLQGINSAREYIKTAIEKKIPDINILAKI